MMDRRYGMQSSRHAVLSPDRQREGKRITVYVNGDPFMPGKVVTMNKHNTPQFDIFCEFLTERVPNRFGGCYRRLYTPGGTEVRDLDQIEGGHEYVASRGRYRPIVDRGQKINYTEISQRTRNHAQQKGHKKNNDFGNTYQPVYHAVNKHHRELSSKAKKRMAEIHGLRLKVHENGKGYKPCCKVTVDYKQRRDINQVLMEIDKHLDSAPIDRIYKVEGNGNFIEVTDPSDLEMDQHIVAVPKSHKSGLDRFERYNMDGKMNIKVNTAPIIGQPYLHNPFPEVHPYQGKGHNRSFSKYKPLPGIGTKSDGGSPYSNPPTNRTKHSRQPVKEVDYDKDEGGKFRARGSQNQKGAKQVNETKDTRTERPIDQMEAETVDEEDIRNEKSTPIPPGTELNKQPSKEQKQNAEATNQTNREEKMDENTARSRDRRSPDVSFRRHDLSPQATNQPRSSTPTPRPDSGSKHQQQQKQQQQQKIQKEDEAATRIQAGFRGHNARKEYQKMKAEQNQEGPSKQQQDQQKLQQQQQQQQQQQDQQKQQQQQQQQQKPKTDPTNTGKSKDELDEAASKIQAAFKGHQVRKDMKTKQQVRAQKELKKQDEHERNNAAIKIQSNYKGYKARQNYKIKKSELESKKVDEVAKKGAAQDQAATKIQSGFRGYKVRKDIKEQKNQKKEEETLELNKSDNVDKDNKVKPGVAKSDKQSLSQEQAASKIQAGFRGYKTRKDITVARDTQSDNKIENSYENKTDVEEAVKEKEIKKNKMSDDDAATKIQASFRGHATRKNLKNTKKESQLPDEVPETKEKSAPTTGDQDLEKAATKIQSSFRGYQARKEHKSKVNEHVDDEDSDIDQLPESSFSYRRSDQLIHTRMGLRSNTIQVCFRAYKSRKEIAKNQSNKTFAVMRIQSAFIGFRERKNFRNNKEKCILRKEEPGSIIKTHFRAFKERHTKHYSLLSVNKIHAAFRGYVTRKLNHIQTKAYRQVLSVENGDYYATIIQALCYGYITRQGIICVRRLAASSARSVQGPTETEIHLSNTQSEQVSYWQNTNIKMISDRTRRLAASNLQAAYYAYATRKELKLFQANLEARESDGNKTKDHIKKQNKDSAASALSVQCSFRSFHARKSYPPKGKSKPENTNEFKMLEKSSERVDSTNESVSKCDTKVSCVGESEIIHSTSVRRKRNAKGEIKDIKSKGDSIGKSQTSVKSQTSISQKQTEEDFGNDPNTKSNVRSSTTLSGTAKSVHSESILNLSEVKSETDNLSEKHQSAQSRRTVSTRMTADSMRSSGAEVEKEGESLNEIEDDAGELSSLEKNVTAVSSLQAAFRAYKVRRDISELLSEDGELMDISKIDRAVSALKKDFRLRSNKVRRLGSYQFDKDKYEGWSSNWWEGEGISDPHKNMQASVIQMCFQSYSFRKKLSEISVLSESKDNSLDKSYNTMDSNPKVDMKKDTDVLQKTVKEEVCKLKLDTVRELQEVVTDNADKVKLVRKPGSLPGYTARQGIRLGASEILNKKKASRMIEAAFRGYQARNPDINHVKCMSMSSQQSRIKSASTERSFHVELKSNVINDRVTHLQAAFAAYQTRKVFMSLSELVSHNSKTQPSGPERMGSLSETDDFKLRHKSIAKMQALFHSKNKLDTGCNNPKTSRTIDSGFLDIEKSDILRMSRSKSGLSVAPVCVYSVGKSKTLPLISHRNNSKEHLTGIEIYIKKKNAATVLQAHVHGYLTRQQLKESRSDTEEESPEIVRVSTATVKREAERRKDLVAARQKSTTPQDSDEDSQNPHELRMRTASVKLEGERRKAIAEKMMREKSKSSHGTTDSIKLKRSKVPVPTDNSSQNVQVINTSKEYDAAVIIQKAYRGHNVRKTKQHMKNEKQIDVNYEKRKEEQINAARAIQSGWRGFSTRRQLKDGGKEDKKHIVPSIISLTPSETLEEESEMETEEEKEFQPRPLLIINIGRTKSEIERAEQRYEYGSIIQRVYRASKLRRKINVKAALIRSKKREASTFLQAICRSYLVRERFINLESVDRIQSYARAFLCRSKMIKKQKELEEERRAKRNRAASVIQSVIEGHTKRTEFAAKQAEKKRNAEENKAVLDIQSAYRGFIIRKELGEKLKEIRTRSANTVQASVKGFKIRFDKERKRTASLIIRAAFDGFLKRKLHQERLSREHKASTVIQASIKGKLNHKQHVLAFARRNEAAVTIQSGYRGHKARKHAAHVRQVKHMSELAHVIVEEIMDRCLLQLQQRCDAATRIQATFEGFNTRLKLQTKLDLQAIEKIRQRDFAAMTIQTMFRIHCARIEMEKAKNFETETAAAMTIQKFYRGHIVREKMARERKIKIECEKRARKILAAAECIQIVTRAHKVRRQLTADKLGRLQEASAVKIQKVWRGYSVRKETERQRTIISKIQPPFITEKIRSNCRLFDDEAMSDARAIILFHKKVTELQEAFRAYKTRREVKYRMERKDEIVDQTPRRPPSGQGYTWEDHAAVGIQRVFRGYSDRKMFERMVKVRQKQRWEAATVIQASVRGYFERWMDKRGGSGRNSRRYSGRWRKQKQRDADLIALAFRSYKIKQKKVAMRAEM